MSRPRAPRVVNVRRAIVSGHVLVDRTTDWGNFDAYVLESDPDPRAAREKAVRAFRAGLARRMSDSEYRERLRRELAGKTLGCWCAPLPCHATTLLAAANCGDLLD